MGLSAQLPREDLETALCPLMGVSVPHNMAGEGPFLPRETSRAHTDSTPCAPRLGGHTCPAPEASIADFEVASKPWLFLKSIYLCCSPTARGILLGRVESKIRPREGRKGKRRHFCAINKPCVPNFTLILSLAVLPFINTRFGKAEGRFCRARWR